MELQERNFLNLLKASVRPEITPQIQDAEYSEILKLAEQHAVTGLLYPPLKKILPMTDPTLRDLKKRSFTAATRESLQSKELGKIFEACEKAQLPILPLKGCVIKALYPYPELRFMSDADLLIPEDKAQTMRQIMEEQGFRFHRVENADTDVYISPVGLNYEIHKSLSAEGFNDQTREFAEGLLQASCSKDPYTYVRELSAEDHYVYILCHFIKHFIYGGIGVRQLTDLYICSKDPALDHRVLQEKLIPLGLWDFYCKAEELWKYWFEEGASTPLTEELSRYILTSGVFGTEDKRSTDRILANSQGKHYFQSRLFPSFRKMVGFFPILNYLPFLLPFLWIWRVMRALLFRRGKLQAELKAVESTDQDSLQSRRRFYRSCGLTVYDE